jgi:peptide-methionine (R)-S-oxide reductase
MQLTEDEWKKKLTPEQYRILRQKGTEAPFTGEFFRNDETGKYSCVACGAELFDTRDQHETHVPGLAGWPSFAEVAKSGHVKLVRDDSYGMERTEVVCAECGGHLGHLFDDDTMPTGKHYCINSACLAFKPEEKQ